MPMPTSEPLRPAADQPDARASLGRSRVARRLPLPTQGRWAGEEYVAKHLGHLVERRRAEVENRSSSTIRGGQTAADAALRRLVLQGYADGRRHAYPQPRRAVSGLSPWIRHGLLSLQRVWDSVAGGHPADVDAFRQALLLQEYGRHLYARLGSHLGDLAELVPELTTADTAVGPAPGTTDRRAAELDGASKDRHRPGSAPGWDRRMGCLDLPLDELEEDGWLVGEGRRWLAAWWLRHTAAPWHDGDDQLFRHLLDGSRSAGRLSWLRSQGLLGGRPQPFSRWEVERLAPGLCASCELVYRCPIERLADGGAAPVEVAAARPVPGRHVDEGPGSPVAGLSDRAATAVALLAEDPDLGRTSGPLLPATSGDPEVVWVTAESLGDADPALAAHPRLPVVFVFDEPLLARLRLSSGRLSFLVETLAELGTRRRLELWLGDPTEVLAGRRLAATFTPVPGWRRRSEHLDVVATHPWPWLRMPISSRIDSHDCWLEVVS